MPTSQRDAAERILARLVGAVASLERASSMRSAFYDKKAILLAKLLARLGYLIDHPDHPTRPAWEKDTTETIHALLDEPGLVRGDLDTLSNATAVTHDARAMLEVTGTFRRRFPTDVDAGYYHASALHQIGALEAARDEAKWVLEQARATRTLARCSRSSKPS